MIHEYISFQSRSNQTFFHSDFSNWLKRDASIIFRAQVHAFHVTGMRRNNFNYSSFFEFASLLRTYLAADQSFIVVPDNVELGFTNVEIAGI